MNLDAVVDDLIRWEGFVSWLYLDTREHVTVGIGMLLRDVEAAFALPFTASRGQQASHDEIRFDFERVAGMEPGLAARFYRAPCSVELPTSTMRALAVERLNTVYLPGLRALLLAFDSFPAGPQSALIDMSWNLGLGGLAKFGNLLHCCRDQDWEAAAVESHVYSSSAARNAWRATMFQGLS